MATFATVVCALLSVSEILRGVAGFALNKAPRAAPSLVVGSTNIMSVDNDHWMTSEEAKTGIAQEKKVLMAPDELGVVVPPVPEGVLKPFDMFPQRTFPMMETIQGGSTVRTYKMPSYADRCQIMLATAGRPLKANIELWLGPQRVTHRMRIDSEDGLLTPIMSTLKFKKLNQVLKISTASEGTFPLYAAVSVPSAARAKVLSANTDDTFDKTVTPVRKLIQGGQVTGKGGAVRYWIVPPDVESVQLVATAKNTGKKSFRINVDVLQGPSNVRQTYFLQCGGGCQPYHCVLQTPGRGCTILIKNLKPMEDGNVEVAILPYDTPPVPRG